MKSIESNQSNPFKLGELSRVSSNNSYDTGHFGQNTSGTKRSLTFQSNSNKENSNTDLSMLHDLRKDLEDVKEEDEISQGRVSSYLENSQNKSKNGSSMQLKRIVSMGDVDEGPNDPQNMNEL